MKNTCNLHIYYTGQGGEVAYLTNDMDKKKDKKRKKKKKGIQYINKLDTTKLNHIVHNQGEN